MQNNYVGGREGTTPGAWWIIWWGILEHYNAWQAGCCCWQWQRIHLVVLCMCVRVYASERVCMCACVLVVTLPGWSLHCLARIMDWWDPVPQYGLVLNNRQPRGEKLLSCGRASLLPKWHPIPCSALFVTSNHRTLVKTSALNTEYGVIWDGNLEWKRERIYETINHLHCIKFISSYFSTPLVFIHGVSSGTIFTIECVTFD